MKQIPYLSTTDLELIVSNMVDELEKSSQGQTTSLPYLKNPLPRISHKTDLIQCLVMGGTVFEKALVKRSEEGMIIISSDKVQIPVMKNVETFLDFIIPHIDPQVTQIGLCFTFPLEPVIRADMLDGILIRGTKEHDYVGLVGKPVGQTLEEVVLEKTGRKVQFAVANDTVCLVLAGKSLSQDINGLAGGINGTGMNFGFFDGTDTIINLESGNFNRFPFSEAAKQVDADSNSPGSSLFEKEVAGGYLRQLFSYYCPEVEISSTEYISNIAKSSEPYATVAEQLLKRSARLLACQIAGIYHFKKRPMMFVMEGSVFVKGYRYQDFVEEALRELGVAEHIAFEKIDRSSLIGAAQLVL